MPQEKQLNQLYRHILKYKPRPRDIRRTEVIAAVIDLIAEKGIDEVTFESVGHETGMARSHVVYYFKNRRDLVESSVRFVAHTAQQIIAEQLEGHTQWESLLEQYIKANFDWVESYPTHASVMLLLYYQASFLPKYRELHAEIRGVGEKRVASILRLNPSLKRMPLTEIKSLSRGIQALITGHLLDVVTTKGKKFKQARKDAIQQASTLIEKAK